MFCNYNLYLVNCTWNPDSTAQTCLDAIAVSVLEISLEDPDQTIGVKENKKFSLFDQLTKKGMEENDHKKGLRNREKIVNNL